MDINRAMMDVIALAFLSQQLLAFGLKRDNQEKYAFWPLLLPPLLLSYLIAVPSLMSDQGQGFSPFEVNVLTYQAVVVVLALMSRFEKQAGQIGFWLAAALNLGSCGAIFYYAHGWSM